MWTQWRTIVQVNYVRNELISFTAFPRVRNLFSFSGRRGIFPVERCGRRIGHCHYHSPAIWLGMPFFRGIIYIIYRESESVVYIKNSSLIELPSKMTGSIHKTRLDLILFFHSRLISILSFEVCRPGLIAYMLYDKYTRIHVLSIIGIISSDLNGVMASFVHPAVLTLFQIKLLL